jgi:uncharacterized membrane protein YfcA
MEQLIILSLIFFIISGFFSMFGAGGGILYVPILLLAGFSFDRAPAISLILITATSLAALYTFSKKKKVDWKLALIMDPPTDIMAFAGGFLSSLIPESILKTILTIILFIAGVLMYKKRSQNAIIKQSNNWWIWHRNFNGQNYAVNLPLVLIVTAMVGLLSGMLGITGGIIKLPIMVLLCGVPMDIAVATSTVMVAITALSGLAGHALNGSVDWKTGAVLAVAAVAGGLSGSSISININKELLKRIFAVVVWLVAFKMAASLGGII